MNENLIYWLALKKAKGIGEIKFLSLLEKYKDPEVILKDIVKPKNLTDLIDYSKKEIERCIKLNIEIITYLDEHYPENLKNIQTPPPFIFIKGRKELLQRKNNIAIVGTRNPSSYGKKILEIFIPDIVKFNILIVSGLAKGIDGFAHKLVLKEDGDTIAVIGSGLDIKYPAINKRLFDEISEKGLIISEFFTGTLPEAQNFPKRNRIISVLSKGVVVIEAGKKSGSIITAMHAIEQGKDVFAFPGNVFSYKSIGNHFLIKNGAYLIENSRDLLEILFPEKLDNLEKFVEKNNIEFDSENEEKIYNLLKNESISIDGIILKTNLDYGEVFSTITSLQLKGLIYEQPGKIYSAI